MVKTSALSVKKVLAAVSGKVLHESFQNGENLDDLKLTHVAEPLEAQAGGVAFVISEAFLEDARKTSASLLVVQNALAEKILSHLPSSVQVCIGCDDAYLGLAHVTREVVLSHPHWDWNISDEGLDVNSAARISSQATVHESATIGTRTLILPGVVIGPEVQIGSDCVLFPGVVVYPRCTIGNRVRVHSNTVIGSDGFGYARGKMGATKIWHLGRVVIQDDVEIGAGVMIDRGTIKDTVIETGAKLDNLVQVGHNGWIRAHAVLCGQAGLAGNVTVGRGAILAGKAGIADKIVIGDGAIVGPMTGVSKDIKAGEMVMGSFMARPKKEWWRLLARIEKLSELFDRVKALEGKSNELD